MNFRTISIAVVFSAIFLTACSNSGGYGNTASTGYGTEAKTEQASKAKMEQASEVKTVTIKNFAFEPAVITISAGDTLVFVNEDSAPHTATATDGAFGTEQLASGESGSVVVDTAGSYEYFCTIHPSMKGTVVVQ